MTSCIRSLVLCAALSSCSVMAKPDFTKCSTNSDCQSAFGIGATCSTEGLCREPQFNPRCQQTFPEDLLTRPQNYLNAVVFGSLMNRSVIAQQGRERSSRLAAQQLNEAHGIDGRTVAIVYCSYEKNPDFDNLETVDAAIASARYLTEVVGVPAIIGPSGSADVSAVYQALRGSGVLLISPSATSHSLTDLEPVPSDAQPGLLWRTAPPDNLQAETIAEDMAKRGVTDVFVIAQKGDYGEGLVTLFRGKFSANFKVRYFGTSNERNSFITEAASSTASEVLFISSIPEDVSDFLIQAGLDTRYANKTFFLTDSAATQEVIDKAPVTVRDRVRGTRPTPVDSTDTAFSNFRGSYASEYAGADVTKISFAAHTYDATWLVFYGSAWAYLHEGNNTGIGIARGLRKLSAGDEVLIQPISWGGIVKAFRSGTGVNVRGASGTLDYNPDTEELSAPIQVWVIGAAADGGYEVQPAEP